MFVAEAALIALREGLEAFLIVGILLGFVLKLGRPDARKWVWIGLGVGVLASVLLGVVVQVFLLDVFEAQGGGEWFELVAALVAVVVLTYMVFWMWQHTRGLMVELREKVGAALEKNMLWVIAFLVFFSTLREGLEVVLFYAALAQRNTAFDLVWSGLVGAVLSAGIAFAIFRTTTSFNLQKFFAVTGILLVFVAAGLLVHSVHAAMDLGLVPEQPALWDTSSAIPDDRADGRILHALFGYTAQPNLLQCLLYFGYIFGVGIPYLIGLGAFRRSDKTVRKGAVVAVLAVVWLASIGTAWGASDPMGASDHGHDEEAAGHAEGIPHAERFAAAQAVLAERTGKVGILLRDHGEAIHYNASTYESMKEFITHIWGYTPFPPEALSADQGTILLDTAHLYDSAPSTSTKLIDAWVQPFTGLALPFGDPANQGYLDEFCPNPPPFYVVPSQGPGWGEGDLYEILGLCTYRDWQKMMGESPRHDQGLVSWSYIDYHLHKHFGDKVVVAFAHGHDPKVNASHTLDAAAKKLADAGVDVVLDAYQSSVFSDAMNGCMMAPHTEQALRAAGFKGEIVPVGQAGTHELWGNATALFAEQIASRYPSTTKVAIHLTQHGAVPGSPNPCAPGYDPTQSMATGTTGEADQYHENLVEQYAMASKAVEARLAARGNVTVRHVYGAGASSPDDGVLAPREAVALDQAEGIPQSIFIPYEFWGDALDNLVYLRESLGLQGPQAPYYDENFETRTSVNGQRVLVTSAFFSTELKSDAQLARIAEAIEGLSE